MHPVQIGQDFALIQGTFKDLFNTSTLAATLWSFGGVLLWDRP